VHASDNDSGRLHTPDIRTAGKELLSLALMDARNRSLRWASVIRDAAHAAGKLYVAEDAASRGVDTDRPDRHGRGPGGAADDGLAAASTMPFAPAPVVTTDDRILHRLGQLGWFQEYWIARNVQRHRGDACDASAPKLASIDPMADEWWSIRMPVDGRPLDGPPVDGGQATLASGRPPPDIDAVHQYLLDTLEVTLELLSGADQTDDALYFYRLALLHEDRQSEAFAQYAQRLGLATPAEMVRRLNTAVQRPALSFNATRWMLGMPASGFVFDDEKWSHAVDLPDYEIDSQPVTWAQYGEFVEDGGYDEERFWDPQGWRWVQREGRRCPRYVEQLRRGVLVHRNGQTARVPMDQPVMHVTWWEADAWCRWAGRMLPGETQWEAAAHLGASRGFSWGNVREWTASSARAYPNAPSRESPGMAMARTGMEMQVPDGRAHGLVCKVVRGASFATRGRLRHARQREFLDASHDEAFVGFRSCTF
jgi:formylglycine-generating enzyme required for sulfatase activity